MFAILITIFIAKKILVNYEHRKSIGYKFNDHDIKWSVKILIFYPIYALICGMMAGLLGIGGGLVIGPLLLDLGLHPIVSSATCNFLVLFISSQSSVQFMLNVFSYSDNFRIKYNRE